MNAVPPALPPPFAGWFAGRGWTAHAHQLALIARAASPATLLVAPTGGGKTLAGFLPSLIELGARPAPGLHTLYVSPLKALAADIRRNLGTPLAEMDLAIRVEDRTGDTGAGQRARQRVDPPHILLTTPESLALMLSYEEAPRIFAGVSRVIVDEIHALAESKRGDQLMLCLARLETLAPRLRRVGLSATVEDPPALAAYLGERRGGASRRPRTRTRRFHSLDRGAAALGRPDRPLRRPRRHGADPRGHHHPRLHQHAGAGRALLPGALGREQRRPPHRPPPRLAFARGPRPGRGGDGGGVAARHRRHRQPRSRHRLGRRRPRGAGRRAEERQAPRAADRPRQPPLQRPLARRARAGEPLRGAGMPRRARRRARARRSTASRADRDRSTSSASTSCSSPAPAPSTPTPSSPRSAAPVPTARSRARTSTPASTSAPPAATRSAPTTAGNDWCSATASGRCATRGGRARSA